MGARIRTRATTQQRPLVQCQQIISASGSPFWTVETNREKSNGRRTSSSVCCRWSQCLSTFIWVKAAHLTRRYCVFFNIKPVNKFDMNHAGSVIWLNIKVSKLPLKKNTGQFYVYYQFSPACVSVVKLYSQRNVWNIFVPTSSDGRSRLLVFYFFQK